MPDGQSSVAGRRPQVLKGRHYFQWPVIIPERHCCPHPNLLLRQNPSLPVVFPCVEIQRWVAAVQRRPRYGHVTGRAVGVGAVPFLQNHYRVPHMAVQKVDPEVGARCRPPLAAHHWTPNCPGRSRERDPINPGVRCDRWCFPLRGPLFPVLGLVMGCQQPRRQLQLTLRTPNSLPLLLLKG